MSIKFCKDGDHCFEFRARSAALTRRRITLSGIPGSGPVVVELDPGADSGWRTVCPKYAPTPFLDSAAKQAAKQYELEIVVEHENVPPDPGFPVTWGESRYDVGRSTDFLFPEVEFPIRTDQGGAAVRDPDYDRWNDLVILVRSHTLLPGHPCAGPKSKVGTDADLE